MCAVLWDDVSSGARWGRGKIPNQTEKIVIENALIFQSSTYKMTNALEDRRENWEKIYFPLRFWYTNFKIFSRIFKS